MKIKSISALVLALCMLFCVAGCGKTVEYTSEVWVDGEETTSVIEGQDGYYVDGENSGSSGNAQGNNSTSGGNKNPADENGNSNGGAGDNGNTGNTGGNGNNGNNGAGNNNSNGGNTDNNNSNSGGSNGKKDMGGAKVVIGSWGASPVPAATSPQYAAYTKKIKDIESTYNCKIDYKIVENAVEYKNAFTSAAMSGIKYADIVHLGSGWVFPQHLRNGFLHPLDSYVDIKDIGWDPKPMEQSVVNGKHYLLFTSNNYNGISGVYFNRAVFKKFGINDPASYVASNNWTTETFLELAKKCTGVKDGVQYYGFTLSKAGVDTWGSIYGGKSIQKVKGKYVYNPDQKFINGIQFAHDLKNKHKVTGEGWDQGRVAMIAGATWDGNDVAANVGGENVGWTYLPKGPGQSDYYCRYSSSEW